MTGIAGGAIAFPVMTLAFEVQPIIAKDFGLIVQSAGLTAATFAILFMKVKTESFSLVLCSIGGFIGNTITNHKNLSGTLTFFLKIQSLKNIFSCVSH